MLVCCTDGAEGEILNPALDTPEVRADLAGVRRRELDAATAIIGYDEVVMLGYRDSGMAGSEANAHPGLLRRRPARRGHGAPGGRRPPHPAPGHGHLRRRPVGLSPPGPPAGPRGRPGRLPGGRRPGAVPRGRARPTSPPSSTTRSTRRPGSGPSTTSSRSWASSRRSTSDWRARWDSMPEEVADHGGRHHRLQPTSAGRPCWPTPPRWTRTSKFWFGLPPEVMESIQPHDDYRLAFVGDPDGTVREPGRGRGRRGPTCSPASAEVPAR